MAFNKAIVKNAVNIAGDNLFNVVSEYAPFPLVQFSDGIVTRLDDKRVANVFANNVWLDTNTTVGGLIASGGFVDFWIRHGEYDLIDEIVLSMTLTNNGTTAITFPAIQQMLLRMEIWANNGADLLSSIDGDYLYCLTSSYNANQWALKSIMQNTTAQWGNNTTGIAVGASQTFYLQFRDTLLNQIKLNVKYINGDAKVRFYFLPWTVSGATGATAPTISQIGLIINQINLDTSDMQAKAPLYKNVGDGVPDPVWYRYLDAIRFNYQSMAMTGGQTYKFPLLGSVQGMISHIYFFLRPSGATGFALNNMIPINWFDIQDNSGNSIIQFPQPSNFNLYNEFSQINPESTMPLYKNMYTYNFNVGVQSSYATGSQGGFYPFYGYESLVVNMPSTLSAGNYDLVSYWCQYKILKERDGVLIASTAN